MISVLIPVFNAQVHELVQELSNQLNNLSIEGEILVYDDCSDTFFKEPNRIVASLKSVAYKELDKNYGRAGIRQALAADAKYDWLLFIDSDSVIIDQAYLQNYIQAIGKNYDVYAGGRIYESKIPDDCTKHLHWKYGKERESVKGSSTALHTNNFCIQKDIFLQLSFPPQLTGYGHEDTWMQIQLEQANKTICFIDNPVLHSGLETADRFLEKTRNALKNLLVLAYVVGDDPVKNKVSLYKLYLLQKKLGATSLIEKILAKKINTIEVNLRSCNPSLFQFDLYRLYYLIQFAKKKDSEK
jgi:glycosyltransferase involved in cell wall biosynthesis